MCIECVFFSASAGALVCVGPSGEPAMDLDVAAAENQEFLSTRKSERQEMIVLNDRLAVYINKVKAFTLFKLCVFRPCRHIFLSGQIYLS